MAKAAAAEAGRAALSLFLGGAGGDVLPVPMMNVLNGGAHADNRVDFQEFMVVPAGAERFADALRMGTEVFHALKGRLQERGLSTAVGRRGRLRARTSAPTRRRSTPLIDGIEAAGYEPGADLAIALDPATSELFEDGTYVLEHEGRTLSPAELADYWAGSATAIPSSRSRTAWTRRTGTAGRP